MLLIGFPQMVFLYASDHLLGHPRANNNSKAAYDSSRRQFSEAQSVVRHCFFGAPEDHSDISEMFKNRAAIVQLGFYRDSGRNTTSMGRDPKTHLLNKCETWESDSPEGGVTILG